MRKIIVVTYLTMDGVMQAPGGPEEDPSNGFKWGGWTFQYWDEPGNTIVNKIMSAPRHTYSAKKMLELVFQPEFQYPVCSDYICGLNLNKS